MQKDVKFAILSTDLAVFTIDGGDLKILLTTAQSGAFKGMLALPGGLIDPEEKTESAAKRILAEAISSKDDYMEQLYTFGDPKRDPIGRVVSVAYLVLIPWNKARVSTKNGAIWQSVKTLPKLAYDHNEIVKIGVKRIVGKLTYTNIVFGLMPEEFTLTELQSIYENILGRGIDKRNFRKKINSLKILKKLTKKRKGEANRPATLYSFKDKNLEEVEIL